MARHNPYSVKIELIDGCTERCPFCPFGDPTWVQGHTKWHFMDFNLFKGLCDDLAQWLPKHRMELDERGEPSFWPHLIPALQYARATLPKVQITMTSNGDMINRKKDQFVQWTEELFNAGLNVLVLDCYTQERYEVMCALFPGAEQVMEGFSPYRYYGGKVRVTSIVNATAGNYNAIRFYHNRAGSVNIELAEQAGYKIASTREPLQKMCVKPFRELVIHVDGSVILCCNDWDHKATIGRFPDKPLAQLWQDMDYPYRERLLHKDRASLVPCAQCSDRAGFRVGLEMAWFNDKDL